MTDHLPKVHPGVPQENRLEADSKREAVGLDVIDGTTVMVGDETKDEFIKVEQAEPIDVEEVR